MVRFRDFLPTKSGILFRAPIVSVVGWDRPSHGGEATMQAVLPGWECDAKMRGGPVDEEAIGGRRAGTWELRCGNWGNLRRQPRHAKRRAGPFIP